jgi:hypothetical protein
MTPGQGALLVLGATVILCAQQGPTSPDASPWKVVVGMGAVEGAAAQAGRNRAAGAPSDESGDELAQGLEAVLDQALENARAALRQGLLARAEAELLEVEASGSGPQRARALLLSGNIAFERGHYTRAEERYGLSEEAFEQAVSSGAAGAEAGLAAAAANRALANEELGRARGLEVQSKELSLAAAGALATAFALLALLGWRSRPGSPASK